MSARWADTDYRVVRSYANRRVWVPVVPDDDMTCFLYAGTLAQAKAKIIADYDDVPTRWRHEVDADDTYVLQVKADDLAARP